MYYSIGTIGAVLAAGARCKLRSGARPRPQPSMGALLAGCGTRVRAVRLRGAIDFSLAAAARGG